MKVGENYIMRIIAKGYTKSQIISMAKYFNKQKSNNVKQKKFYTMN